MNSLIRVVPIVGFEFDAERFDDGKTPQSNVELLLAFGSAVVVAGREVVVGRNRIAEEC